MLNKGDDVIVVFDGEEHDGEVERVGSGWVRATIVIDPEWDYGSGTDRLSAHQTVMVRERDVRLR